MTGTALQPLGVQVLEPSRVGAIARASLQRLPEALHELAGTMRTGRADAGCERLLGALCAFLGPDKTVRELRDAVPLDREDLETGVLRGMANLGFRARTAKVKPHRLGGDNLPALVALEGEQPVVVFRSLETKKLMALTGDGSVQPLARARRAQRLRVWTFALAGKDDALAAARRAQTGQRFLGALISGVSAAAPALVVTSLCAAVLGSALPLFTLATYANVIGLGELSPLPALVAGMVLVVALEGLFLLQRGKILAFLAARLDYLVSTASFERILRLSPQFAERAAVTDQAARVRTFDSVRDFITGPAASALLEAPAALVALGVVAYLAGPLVSVLVCGIAAHLAIFVLLRRRVKVLTNVAAEEATQLQRLTIETMEKLGPIQECGLGEIWAARIATSVRRAQRAQFDLRMSSVLAETLAAGVTAVTAIALLAFGAQAVWSGAVHPSALLAVVILGLRSMVPSSVIAMSIQRVQQLSNSLAQVNALMELRPEHDDERSYSALRPVSGAVSMINVGFRGTDTRPLFAGLDLEITPGDVVGITGQNGTGKSVILKLIQGMADPSIGAVWIDGVDIRQLPLNELRRRIGYVPQQPALFPGTIKDNLRHANPLATDEEVEEIMQRVGVSEDDIGGAGARREYVASEILFRVAFGQALMTNSRLILIDEIPNGLLAGQVGLLMRKILDERPRGTTVVFVSHRSDVLSLAQRVVTLRYGKVPVVLSSSDYLERAA